MNDLKYTLTRGPLMDPVGELELDQRYLMAYKANVEKQLAVFLKQIIDDDAVIELTVAPNGKEILYWKVSNWNAAGYDKLITSNIY
ncbi:MAG: hypothetical protein ABI581_14270 [Sediminibacterium sp.]